MRIVFLFSRIIGPYRFDTWIRTIDSYSGNDFIYLNSKGIILPAAVMSKGEKRENGFRETALRSVEGDGVTSDEEIDVAMLKSADMEG